MSRRLVNIEVEDNSLRSQRALSEPAIPPFSCGSISLSPYYSDIDDHEQPATSRCASAPPRAPTDSRQLGLGCASLSFLSDTDKVSPTKLAHDEVQDKTALGIDDMEAQEDGKSAVPRVSTPPDATSKDPVGMQIATTATPNGIKSSPPVMAHDSAMDLEPLSVPLDENGAKSDSEAETIVLPGKDGHSPSKARKSIKHEDKSDDEGVENAPDVGSLVMDASRVLEGRASEAPATTLGKRKRVKNGNPKDDGAHPGNSSGLSSVPTSPIATTRSSLSKPAASDSDISKSPSPRPRSGIREHTNLADRALQHKGRYASGSGDEDEVEAGRFVRRRSSGADHRLNKDVRSTSKSNLELKLRKESRSTSPQPRAHRRSISTQLPARSSHGLSHKKKRIPAPLQSTEYKSDDSSASENSHPRSSRLRSLAAPPTGDLTMSPAKMNSHKKHVNSSGQTLLARACQSNKLDIARQRFEERPEDLNYPDNAGNTPLHAASLAGHSNIVKFLLANGNCIVDPVNDQKDTPLHDAIENGWVIVVKLLLNAGANPRKPNREGNEPLDLVNDEDDDEDAEELRTVIREAMRKTADARRESEDDHENTGNRLSHPIESPRHTPPAQSLETHHLGARRVGTSRSIRTKDGNLYQPLNVGELRRAAREGDEEATARILSVMENLNDVKSLYNAAKGGHVGVMNLHFGIGNFHPDPPALEDKPENEGTPLLVAIGRDNHLEVLKLILAQSDFDPTRLTNGMTYYEYAKKRAGPHWQDELSMLKEAFLGYKKNRKSPGKVRSPGLRRDGRDSDRDPKNFVRKDEQQASRSHKRNISSPKAREQEHIKSQHRSSSSVSQSRDGPKRGPGRPRKEESTATTAISDRESSPLGPPKQKSQAKRSESDLTVASESEATVKPRRKLISGKERRGELELVKQRRASIASNASSVSVKDKRERDSNTSRLDDRASPNLSRISKHGEQDNSFDKHSSEKDRARSLKRDDSKDRLSAIRGESPAKRPRKSETPPRSNMQDVNSGYGAGEGPPKRRKLESSSSGRKSDSTPGSSPEHHTSKPKSNLSRDNSLSRSSKAHGETRSDDTTQKNHKVNNDGRSEETSIDNLAIQKAEKEEAAREARIKHEREEREAKQKKEKEEEERREQARIEEARQARLAREEAAREEEEKREREEAERKERQQREDAEARNRAMEEQRALYLEQERLKKEEQDRRRALAQEQARAEKAKLEQQKREERLAKLPFLLRWLELSNDPKTPEVASLFRAIAGYRYDTIKSEATGQSNAREQWMLNTQVATLLGEKDLQLSRYTAWERIPLTNLMKRGVWKTQNEWFTLRHFSLPQSFRRQFTSSGEATHVMVSRNKELFLELELFFVKVSEFMFVVPNFPHLRSVEMEVQYRELVLPVSHPGQIPPSKWKLDPDTDPNQRFVPTSKYFANGEFVRKGQFLKTRVLSAPPTGDERVPRRNGLTRVYPGEPDFEDICRQQGLHSFLPNEISPASENPPQTSDAQPHVNGFTPPRSDVSKSVNGGSPHGLALPNGIHEHRESSMDAN